MKESLFSEYVKGFMPKLQKLIELVNGKRGNKQTYLHKTMLRKEYSADQKWESASVNTQFVAADMVSMDSELPAKARDSVARATGILPKIGMKKILRETQINAINIMKAQGATATQIANKLSNDAIACAAGIDEKNEFNFLVGLSDGVVAVDDANNEGTALRVDFGYLAENTFGVKVKDAVDKDAIHTVLSKADADGNSPTTMMLSLATYNGMRQTDWAKELVATYSGISYSSASTLPVPSASKFDEAFSDEFNGINIIKVDRSIIVEKNGKRVSKKPWNDNRIIFLTSEEVGALVWGTLAEKTNPVSGVVYSSVDDYKLISKYSKNDPLQEFTSGQALVLPVIENVDQIYILDKSQVQA